MKIHSPLAAIAVLGLFSFTAEAQQRPAIRQLGPVSAKMSEKFAGIGGIRALSDGAVLLNDIAGRRVLLFDPQLSKFTVVADSTSATANAYSGRIGSLIQYRGDSSIFIDPSSVSMLVIDPAGKIARVMAIPRAEDAAMIGGMMGSAAFDPAGRLVYRAGGGMRMGMGPGGMRQMQRAEADRSGAVRTPNFQIPDPPDSAFILAVNLATRKVDTLGIIRTPKVKLDIQRDDNGNVRAQSMVNPLPVVDDWAVTPDGAVAFVRGRDYHVDWVNPDGTKTSSPKIPFNWQRMTDEDKVAFLDSVKAARERLGPNAPSPLAGALGGGGGGGGGQTMVFSQIAVGPGAPAPGARAGAANPPAMQVTYVPASDLPDYKPPFFAGSTRADSEGNLWIRTIPTEAIAGGPVYDVINRKGELIERVQIPANRVIIGFGPDKSVYLLNREGTTSTVERASIR